MDINKLVTQAKDGDQAALSEIFNAYYNKIYYFALNHVKSVQDAEDIVQNTFIEVFKSIKSLSEPKAFKSWVYLIAERQVIALYRKSGRNPQTVDEDFDEATEVVADNCEFLPENVFETEAMKNAVMELILSLPEAQKTAILLYYYEEMSVREIAEVQSCSEGTVKSRLNYARNYIKSKIEEQRKKGTSLIAVAPLPLLTRLLRELAEQNTMSLETASGILSNVGNATGVTVTVSIASGNATVSGTTATTAAKTGISLLTKVIAGIAAAAVVTTGVIIGVTLLSKPDDANVGGIVSVTPSSPEQTVNTYTPTPMPVTESDYAKLYYQYIQDVLIPRGNFVDAELFDLDDNGNVGLIVKSFDESEGVYSSTCFQVIDNNGAVVAPIVGFLYDHDEHYYPKHMTFIGFYNGKRKLINLYDYVYYQVNTDDETETVLVIYENIYDATNSVSFSARNKSAEYDEKLTEISTYLTPVSTWGIASNGDPLFPIEDTGGERLKNYFDD